MIFSLPGLASVAAVTFDAERTPAVVLTDDRGQLLGLHARLHVDREPRLRQDSTAFLDMSSAMRTLIGSDIRLLLLS
jgi:hypothetical protein